jgi:hypothetical protein
MDTLTNSVNLLEHMVKRDKQNYGLTKGGTFAERVRVNTTSEPGRIQQHLAESGARGRT